MGRYGCMLLVVACLLGCSTPAPCGDTYTVAVVNLPQRFDPRTNIINTFHYMILQLYHPLLRVHSDGKLKSEFLDVDQTQALGPDFAAYRLCLKDNVAFSDGTRIAPEDLKKSLEDAHQVLPVLPDTKSIEVQGRCVRVELSEFNANYLERLTVAASTVVKRGTEIDTVPTGLGAYRVVDWNDQHVVLESGASSKVQFSRIEFIKVKDIDEALARGIMDLNLLYWEPKGGLTPAYRAVKHSILRTYVIVVALSDAQLRKSFVGCFDRHAFLRDVAPVELTHVPGYLPSGMLGSRVDYASVERSLRPARCLFLGEKPRVRYLNRVPHLQSQLEDFFRKHRDELPVEIVVEQRESVFSAYLNGDRNYIGLLGVDSVGSQTADFGEPAVFLDPFYREVRYVEQPLAQVKSLVEQAIAPDSRVGKEALYSAAHESLLKSGHVIPLGQMLPKLYFRPNIGNIEFADSAIGYPYVDKLTCR